MAADRQTVLVIDDTPEYIDILVGALKDEYNVKAAINGEMALKVAYASAPDIILLDILMPGIDGFEVCRRLKSDHATRHIPIIFITVKISIEDELKGLELGAVDYITKPISPPIVRARVKTHLALHDQNRELDRRVRLQTQQLHDTRMKVIQRLGRAAEYKDDDTGLHVIRMSKYAYILGMAVGMNDAEAEILMAAAAMHDIGKIGIPDHILRKPSKLDAEEFAIMQTHCEIGAKIIGDDDSELLQLAKVVALTHHEKWNGLGYPNKLADEQIPRVGRIVAIADVFDALTSNRPYKRAWVDDDAFDLLQSEAGRHFDPQLVPLFVEAKPQILEVKKTYAEK